MRCRSDHNAAIGAALAVPDLGDGGRHVARVVYSPRLSADAALSPAFRASPHLASLVYPRGAAWRHGMGTLSVWVDALGGPPALVVPLPLDTLLPGMGAAGAATIGFTAATGAALQAHELLSWAFWSDADPAAELSASAGLRPPATYVTRGVFAPRLLRLTHRECDAGLRRPRPKRCKRDGCVLQACCACKCAFGS